MKWKVKSFHVFLVHSLSQQSLLSNNFTGLIDQPDIQKKSLNLFVFEYKKILCRGKWKKNHGLEKF